MAELYQAEISCGWVVGSYWNKATQLAELDNIICVKQAERYKNIFCVKHVVRFVKYLKDIKQRLYKLFYISIEND